MNNENQPIKVINFSDIVEANGKTIRENNTQLTHNIPIGTLVEVKFHMSSFSGAEMFVHARLPVSKHTRDCDGTPLYSLRFYQMDELNFVNDSVKDAFEKAVHGYSEESMTIVPPETKESIYDIHKKELRN